MNRFKISKNLILRFVVKVNFYFSVIVLIFGSVLSASDNLSLFEFNEDLYGALDNNLRMILVYLAMTEVVLIIYFMLADKFQLMMFVGFFLMLTTGSVGFYGEINAIEIDSALPLFFLYIGLSHTLFGAMVYFDKIQEIGNRDKIGKIFK
jgi:hypothetical protein